MRMNQMQVQVQMLIYQLKKPHDIIIIIDSFFLLIVVTKQFSKISLAGCAKIILIIIRQPLCSLVGRRSQHAVSKLPCLVLFSAISCRSSICPGRLSTAWLVSLVVFSCHYGLQVVTREVHRLSLRRLICPAQDHFIFLTVYIISMTFVLSLTQMLALLSLFVHTAFSILLSILVCAAASLLRACLVTRLFGQCPGLRNICHSF